MPNSPSSAAQLLKFYLRQQSIQYSRRLNASPGWLLPWFCSGQLRLSALGTYVPSRAQKAQSALNWQRFAGNARIQALYDALSDGKLL